MTLEDETDGLRRALSVAATAPGSVDPVAARRAGDARVRTRTAITTSLAFSLVIFAGLGSVYVAAHRSRPSSLGSDQVTSTPTVVDSAAPLAAPVPLTAGFLNSPVAGRPDVFHVTGPAGFETHYSIDWGDGTSGGDQDNACDLGYPPPTGSVTVYVPHTYAAGGIPAVVVRQLAVCGLPPLTASFNQPVLPGAQPTSAPVSPVTPVRSATPSRSVSATPTLKPTTSVSPGILPRATPTATATPAPTATPMRGSGTASPTASPATARPTGTAKPSPVVSPTPTPSRTATPIPSSHASPSP